MPKYSLYSICFVMMFVACTAVTPTVTLTPVPVANVSTNAPSATHTATIVPPTKIPTQTPLPTVTYTHTPIPTLTLTSTPQPTATPTALPAPSGQIVFEKWLGNDSFSGWGSVIELWISDATGENPHPLTTGFYDTNPVWSPTGEYIAFTRSNALYVILPSGQGLRQIRPGVYTPQWLNGGEIIFISGQKGGRQLSVVSINSYQTRTISWFPMTDFWGLVLSPDKRIFAFTDTSTPLVEDPPGSNRMRSVAEPIYLASFDDQSISPLLGTNGEQLHGFVTEWHPNGEQIVVNEMDGGCLLVNVDGSAVQNLNTLDDSCSLSWSSDGFWRATGKNFNGYLEGNSLQMWVLPAQGYRGEQYRIVSAREVLTPYGQERRPDAFFDSPSWAP